MDKEKRVLAFSSEVRAATDEDSGTTTLTSTAPPYETLSVPMAMMDGRTFREQFTEGAFGDLSGDVMATFQHDDTQILGRTPGTLRLEETSEGLRYQVDLPDTTTGRDVAELVRRGDVRGSSFEFSVNGDDGDVWDENEDGTWTRTVRDATLYQVGPVTKPAYESGTDVALRSLNAATVAPGTPRLDRARRRMKIAERSATTGLTRQ